MEEHVIGQDLVVDFDLVSSTFEAEATAYREAHPFPHIALTGLFDKEMLRRLAAEFPNFKHSGGQAVEEIEGGKYANSDWSSFGKETKAFVAACNSGSFMSALTALTGIEGLLPDPHLSGGGLHQTGRGGRLKVHADFNVHPSLPLTRRLNMLVYLNDPWEESWNGSLELWNREMTKAEVVVPPLLGQVVIFTCSDSSFHGLPDPLECPEGTFRRSLAFYYYTADGQAPNPHGTLFQERPGEDFLSRPSARFRAAFSLLRQAGRTLIGNNRVR